MLDDTIKPAFERFDELANLLEEFANCSLTECWRAQLRLRKNGELGGTEKIKERYEKIYGRPLEYPFLLATFSIVHDKAGNWIAFLVSDSLAVAEHRFYYGKEHNWQFQLIDVVLEAYGLELTDELRNCIWW